MPRRAKELSAVEVKRLAQEVGFHAVGGVACLYLQVQEAKGKGVTASWIFRKVIGDQRADRGLGAYPTVTLQQARYKARVMHQQVEEGVDPRQARRDAREALRAAQGRRMTFDQAARSCHAKKSPEFRSAKHRNDWINSITTHASPHIGTMQVADLDVADVMRVLEPIWFEKTETATRVRQRLQDVFAWAIALEFAILTAATMRGTLAGMDDLERKYRSLVERLTGYTMSPAGRAAILAEVEAA